jgi:nicotinate-nucleotide adenylyltransferase
MSWNGRIDVSMRIGIFGGTFDPPHVGHLILAAAALEQLQLERLLWVLTPDPPHKQDLTISPLPERLELVKAAIQDNPAFELSRIDIDRPGPHYAVDTVHLLAKQFPEARLVYLIGGDSLRDLPTWHDPQGLVEAVSLIGVMRRPDARINLKRLELALPGVGVKVLFIDAPRIEISSRMIRQLAVQGRAFRYYLPERIYHLVNAMHLYQPANHFEHTSEDA